MKVLEVSGKGHVLNRSLIKVLYNHSYTTDDICIMFVYKETQKEGKMTDWLEIKEKFLILGIFQPHWDIL